jgi:hypothetical protein
MARPKDNSLKYYNQDTKDDDNLQYIEAEHGFMGYAIVHKLWKHIYGGPGGYFCPWDEINKKLFCKNNGITIVDLDKILDTCFQSGIEIFNREMAVANKILTSKGIQKRWLRIVKEAGRSNNKVDKLHQLIHLEEEKPGETTPPVVVSPAKSTQSKVNKSKVNKSKVNKSKGEGNTEKEPTHDFFKNEIEKNLSRNAAADFQPPQYSQVDDFFKKKTKEFLEPGAANVAGQKFYNHYKSLGWKTTAGAKVVDWEALAISWILEDLEKSTVKNKGAISKRLKETLSPEQAVSLKMKTKDFIQAVYYGYCEGSIKQDGIPTEIYTVLVEMDLLLLSHQQKNNILTQCNGNDVKAKQMAIASYFTKQKNDGVKEFFVSSV